MFHITFLLPQLLKNSKLKINLTQMTIDLNFNNFSLFSISFG